MSADFWASYLSGALGILIGNHLDVIKVQYQAGFTATAATTTHDPSTLLPSSHDTVQSTTASRPKSGNVSRVTSYLRGSAAPILGYGALNSILFISFNRSLKAMDPAIFDYTKLAGTDLSKIWLAGAIGGLATFVVSTPTELVKCRAQLQVQPQTAATATSGSGSAASSYSVFRHTLRHQGVLGFYKGGVVTALRDSVGYGWYFWSYELSKRLLVAARSADPFVDMKTWETLVAGGVAGVITWASIYPLDVIKTRIQTGAGVGISPVNSREGSSRSSSTSTSSRVGETEALLGRTTTAGKTSSFEVAKQVWQESGLKGFYRGLGICSLRAFIVNAVQWYCYEAIMGFLTPIPASATGAPV